MHLRKNRLKNSSFNILFLARVEAPKGIYEAIESFKIIQKNNPNLNVKLNIAGSGKELDNVKKYVQTNNLTNVIFLGHVDGDNKKNALLDADIYLFPSYHGEGMPNSVLEAMAFGLPIVTRNVGAITDIIINGENGFYTASKDPNVFAKFIQQLIDDPELCLKILRKNHLESLKKYTASKVKERLEKIYLDTINETTHPTT